MRPKHREVLVHGAPKDGETTDRIGAGKYQGSVFSFSECGGFSFSLCFGKPVAQLDALDTVKHSIFRKVSDAH
jgi:hypothetical protein